MNGFRLSAVLVFLLLSCGESPVSKKCSLGVCDLNQKIKNPSGGNSSYNMSIGGSSEPDPCGGCDPSKPICLNDECVECVDNTQCTNSSKSYCLDNFCTQCNLDEQCLHLGLKRCESGKCVECFNETDCGGSICAPLTKTCTSLVPRSVEVCGYCERDQQCKDGMVCVNQIFQSNPTGSKVCTWLRSEITARTSATAQYCSEVQTFTRSVEMPSVDNPNNQSVCTLYGTTCEAWRDYGTKECSIDDDCGIVGLPDGMCKSDGTRFLCTYGCMVKESCPFGAIICEYNACDLL